MTDHICKCPQCKPEAFPEVPFRTPGYVTAHRHPVALHPTWVKVNGEVIKHVREALEGPNGWVIHYLALTGDGRFHRCQCGVSVCTDVKYGQVKFGPPYGDTSEATK